MSRIDRSRASIKAEGFRFEPFRPSGQNKMRLAELDLPPDRDLLAFERGGERRCILLTEAVYHHVIQGDLAGEPYLVSF